LFALIVLMGIVSLQKRVIVMLVGRATNATNQFANQIV